MGATVAEQERALTDLHARLGWRRLQPGWARGEILLGLAAAGAGLLLGQWTLSRPDGQVSWGLAAAGWALFVLGGYLALAGQRSHLYQSGNQRTAYLAELIRQPTTGADPHEHPR